VKLDIWGGLVSTVQSAPVKRSARAANACIEVAGQAMRTSSSQRGEN